MNSYDNLNWTVKVKLSDRGYARLAELHNSYIGTIPHWETRNDLYYKAKADRDGFMPLQFHELIDYFGGFGPALSDYLVDMNILLQLPVTTRNYMADVGIGKSAPVRFGQWEHPSEAESIVIIDESHTLTEPNFPAAIQRMIDFTRRWGVGPRMIGGDNEKRKPN